MSLDEIRKKLAQQQASPKKSKPKSIKKKDLGKIDAKLGQIDISITQEHLNHLFNTIWNLEQLENPNIDQRLQEEFQNIIQTRRLKVNQDRLFHNIQQKTFFKTDQGQIISFEDFRRTWQDLENFEHPFDLGHRREFVGFMTNKYRNYWVNENGNILSEAEFQLFIRIYREKRSIERVIEALENNYLQYLDDQVLNDLLRDLRIKFAQIFKEELLQDFSNSNTK